MTKKTKKTDKTQKKDVKNKFNPILENNKFKITISWQDIKPAYLEATNKLSKKIKLPGFRKGKVPAKFAKQHIDKEQLVNTTLDQIIDPLYKSKLEKLKLKPITKPKINITKANENSDWVIEFEIAEEPNIKIKKDYKNIVKKASKKADETIKNITKQQNKASKKNNQQQKLDDDQLKNIKLQHIFNELINQLEIKIQSLIVEEVTLQELDRITSQLKNMNLDFPQYLQKIGKDFKSFYMDIFNNSLNRIQIEFLIKNIKQFEKITATDIEIDDKIKETFKDKKNLNQYLKNDHYRNYIDHTISYQKTIDFLLNL